MKHQAGVCVLRVDIFGAQQPVKLVDGHLGVDVVLR